MKINRIIVMGLLIAMQIILSRMLSISAWNIRIGFGFIPVVIGAIVYGPITAGIVAAGGDFLGMLIFPIGMYFPGFTLTAFIMGCIWGLFLYRKQGLKRIVIASFMNQFFLGLILNSFWIAILYGAPYISLLTVRIVQSGLLMIIEVVTITAIVRVLRRYRLTKKGNVYRQNITNIKQLSRMEDEKEWEE